MLSTIKRLEEEQTMTYIETVKKIKDTLTNSDINKIIIDLCRKDTPENIKLLAALIALKININEQCYENESTYLMYACQANKTDTIYLLLDNGADPRILNNYELNATYYASRNCEYAIVEKLGYYTNLIILKEKDRLEKDKLKKNKLEIERLETERLEKERLEKERLNTLEKESAELKILKLKNIELETELLKTQKIIEEFQIEKQSKPILFSTKTDCIQHPNNQPETFNNLQNEEKKKNDLKVLVEKRENNHKLLIDKYFNEENKHDNIPNNILKQIENGKNVYKVFMSYKYFYYDTPNIECYDHLNIFIGEMYETGKLDKSIKLLSYCFNGTHTGTGNEIDITLSF